jgi:hypothetical protein
VILWGENAYWSSLYQCIAVSWNMGMNLEYQQLTVMALLGPCCTMYSIFCWQHCEHNMLQHHLYPVLVINDLLFKKSIFFVSLSMAAVIKTLSPLKADETRNLELIFLPLLSVPNVIEEVCCINLQFIRRPCTFWLADLEI